MDIPKDAKITKKTVMYICVEDEESKKYITRTWYSYMLYLCLLLLIVGTLLRSQFPAQSLPWVLFTALCVIGIAGLVVQFILPNFILKDVKIEVQNANRLKLVRVSGNKLSFKDLMTVTILKADPAVWENRNLVDVPEDDAYDEDEEDDEDDEDEEYEESEAGEEDQSEEDSGEAASGEKDQAGEQAESGEEKEE